jgi:hypothetical protein
MQGGRGEFHFGFVSDCAEHVEFPRGCDGVLEKRRLSHTRIAVYHDGAAVTLAGRGQKVIEHLTLVFPAQQQWRHPLVSAGGQPTPPSAPTRRVLRGTPTASKESLSGRGLREIWVRDEEDLLVGLPLLQQPVRFGRRGHR